MSSREDALARALPLGVRRHLVELFMAGLTERVYIGSELPAGVTADAPSALRSLERDGSTAKGAALLRYVLARCAVRSVGTPDAPAFVIEPPRLRLQRSRAKDRRARA